MQSLKTLNDVKIKEIDTINAYKSQKVITEILPSLDNLERALQVESTNEEVQNSSKRCTNGI